MVVPAQQHVKVSADGRLRLAHFEPAARERAEEPDDAVAAAHPQRVAVGQQEPRAEHVEAGVCAARDLELDALVLAKASLQVAGDPPVEVGKRTLFVVSFEGAAPVISDHGRDEHAPELGGERLDHAG